MNRRHLMLAGVALPIAGLPFFGRADAAAEGFEVTRSEAEWRALLSPAEYRVLRGEGTERAGSSPLDKVYAPGLYHCKGCDLPVYSSEQKYDSGTGWPSFWQSLPDAVRTKPDRKLLISRTEVHCRRCGGHFGHVFDDGPAPTGKRHCLNGIALNFVPA
jgi:peptide-methionine (R)-S-oxide reductase